MRKIIILKRKKCINLKPKEPYNFDANFNKPSHFPSSNSLWKKGMFWVTMLWKGKRFGLKFRDMGTINKPKVKLTIYSNEKLTENFLKNMIHEIKYRMNFDQDISRFCKKFQNDKFIGPVIKKWKGMKPLAYNSLYEILAIFFVLQNTTVRRSVQMLENLFSKFGKKIKFDNKILSSFWEPKDIKNSTERELRKLKLGYRAKFFKKTAKQFVNKEINEFALRKKPKGEVKKEMLKVYGIGPASVDYLLFEYFYFLDSLEKLPSWEQKIMSRLIFKKKLVSPEKILNFFTRFGPYKKLAFHYIWEDLFWKREREHIEWLEKEIRL